MEITSVLSVSVLLSGRLFVFSLHQLQLLSKNRPEEAPVNFHRQILMLGTVCPENMYIYIVTYPLKNKLSKRPST